MAERMTFLRALDKGYRVETRDFQPEASEAANAYRMYTFRPEEDPTRALYVLAWLVHEVNRLQSENDLLRQHAEQHNNLMSRF